MGGQLAEKSEEGLACIFTGGHEEVLETLSQAARGARVKSLHREWGKARGAG